jgi:hypothetical protein
MNKMKIIVLLAFICNCLMTPVVIASDIDHTVYQVFRAIDLGEGPPPPKDIFVSIGSSDGVKKGSFLDVYRRISSFDNLTQRHMGDHVIPVGRLKVIYADEKTAIARTDRFVSLDQEPALLPQAVMIGDVVRLVR